MTKEELREVIKRMVPFLIKPKIERKYSLIKPFVSNHAREEVIDCLKANLLDEVNQIVIDELESLLHKAQGSGRNITNGELSARITELKNILLMPTKR